MEINSVNASVPVDRQTLNTENQEPRKTETVETTPQADSEAYRVDLSQEAQTAQASGEAVNSEAVQTYTRGAQIAG